MAKFSILTNNLKRCMTCGTYEAVERHHVFGASERNKSAEYGLIAPLCIYHHRMPPYGVHHNRKNNDKLKAKAHIAFEEHYPDLDFLRIFGRNYKHLLEDEL